MFLAIKVIQEKYEVLLFWPDTRNKSELLLQKKLKNVEYFLGHFNKKNVYIIVHYVLVKIRSVFGKVQGTLDKRSYHLVNLIKGKPKLDSKRKASHFLHDIKSYRDTFRKK